MKRKLSTTKTFQLGDLICELFEEVKKETSNPDEQKVLVYFALRDLFSHQRKQPSKAA